MVELPPPGQPIVDAIDEAWRARRANEEQERAYLGASIVGKPCERSLWYAFRWATHGEGFDGRMLRLFETGHVYERRMLDDLRLAGCDVVEIDEETGGQLGVQALGGHFRGHLDGRATNLPGAPKAEHVVECKTHNDRSFGQLKTHGVAAAKPEHHAQMQVYMHLTGIERALYMAVNKNTDEYYTERVHYDVDVATRLMAKAERIIFADQPPQRISDDPNGFTCRFCSALPICHVGLWARRNCRTCLHSTPRADGTWHCTKWDDVLSIEDQQVGCDRHRYLPGLVAGEIVQVDEADESLFYQMNAGERWVDDGQEMAG